MMEYFIFGCFVSAGYTLNSLSLEDIRNCWIPGFFLNPNMFLKIVVILFCLIPGLLFIFFSVYKFLRSIQAFWRD